MSRAMASAVRGGALAGLLAAFLGAPVPAATLKGEWQLVDTGDAEGQGFGFAIANAGDFDADGYTDLAVGIIFDNTLAEAAGRGMIFFGGPEPANRAPLALFGDAAAHDQFGNAVTGGGDLNCDGSDDVVFAARFNDRAATDGGAVFVFFGGPGADGAADLVIAGPLTDDWFGQAVAIVPDIDGDGCDELLVGAPFNDDNGNASGRALLYRGGPAMDGVPDLIVYGDAQDDGHFGWSVDGAGDVNGDGHGDWIVGARLFGQGTQRARGRAYVYFGGPAADGVADCIYTGERRDDWFGEAVAGVGDVNDDGFDDVAVGAIFWDRIDETTVLSAAGQAVVFSGGTGCAGEPLLVVAGDGADDHMGFSVAGPMAAPGGGPDLWLAGARFADRPDAPAAGEVRLLGRGAEGAARQTLVSHGDAADDHWGHAVAGLPGHVDGFVSGLYAASSEFGDGSVADTGMVTRAARHCIDLQVTITGDVSVDACVPAAVFFLFGAEGSDGTESMSCLGTFSETTFSSGPDPDTPGAVRLLLVAGEDTAGRQFGAGYDSSGNPRPAAGTCP